MRMQVGQERAGGRISQFQDSVLQILDSAIEVDGAEKGNVQLFDPMLDGLRIVGQRGFDSAFLEFFGVVRRDDFCVCGRSFRHKRRVVCHDITADRLFLPYLSATTANGIRAVQSTPVVDVCGRVRGVMSTHFSKVHMWSETAGKALDQFASEMAALFSEYYPDNFGV